jgi:hypothetical protein
MKSFVIQCWTAVFRILTWISLVKGRERWDQMGKRTGQPQSRGPGEEQFIKVNNCHNNNNNNNNNNNTNKYN